MNKQCQYNALQCQLQGFIVNATTHKIKMKGYTLTEFLEVVSISLRTYRRYEKPDSKFNGYLHSLIDGLEKKI